MLSSQPRTRGSLARRYKVASYPAVEPIDVTLEQSVYRVRMNPANFDVLNRINAARITAENILRRPIVQTTYDLFLDDEVYVQERPFFPWPMYAAVRPQQHIEITLQYPPCISVQGVYLTDDSGTETIVDPSLYMVSRTDPCRIRLMPTQQWPAHRGFEPFRIRFTAGYVTPFTVNSSGFIVASNHGLTIGQTIRFSSPAGPPPNPLQSYTDYTVTAITTAPGATASQVSVNDPTGTPVTLTPSSQYAFIGEIPGPIIRAIAMLSTVDRLSEEPSKIDPGRNSGFELPLGPYELLQPFIAPLIS